MHNFLFVNILSNAINILEALVHLRQSKFHENRALNTESVIGLEIRETAKIKKFGNKGGE